MPKVTEQYRTAKRDEIARAAMKAFHRGGFQSTSMADIIAESGLSAGAIYGHYRSKEELILEVAQRVVGAKVAAVEALAGQKPLPRPAALVRALTGGIIAELGNTEMLVQLWGEAVSDSTFRDLAATVLRRLRGVFVSYLSLWQQETHGLSPEAAHAVALEQSLLFVAAAQGYIVQSALTADFDPETYLASVEKYLPA